MSKSWFAASAAALTAVRFLPRREAFAIIDDLLDVTRISQGKVRLQESLHDLRDVVARTVEDMGSVLEGHELSVRLPPDPVRVYGDTTRLAQVIANLLGNAVKFTARGGRIAVHLRVVAEKIVLEVEDSGAGIEPEMLGRLFTPFVQAEQTLDRSHGGLGLGLSLTKALVELHGGTIDAHSAGLGRGARFRVELPLADDGSPTSSLRHIAQTSAASRRILVIEDNEDAAESLKGLLELDGHVVSTAASGTDGLDRARTFRPEIVLCDIGLPGMDGYAVAHALRHEKVRCFLIAMTGYAQPEDVRRAHEAGFDAHLAKPPDFDALARLLAVAP